MSSASLDMLLHDLRGLVTGIAGSVALIDSDRLDDETRAHVERIGLSARQLSDLLAAASGLLGTGEELSRKAAETVDVAGFLREIELVWAPRAAAKDIAIGVDIDAFAPATIMAEKLALTRIFNNVIGNAIKFTDSGKITLRALPNGDGAAFEIDDTGPGIQPDLMDRLFDPYIRGGQSAEPGSGLGLFIARSLVEEMGGTISARNGSDGGCRIRLEVPGASGGKRAEALDSPEDAAGADTPGEMPDLAGMRVLLAEDNVTNQIVAQKMLETMNARVMIASDGAEALELLDSDPFDLLLVDIEMPRVSGLDVIRYVRSLEDARARLPVVALTAYAMDEHRNKIAAAGADGLIAKPLLGIEDFGNQLLGFIAGAASRMQPAVDSDTDAGPVDRAIYDSLAQTIGSEAMAELLEKVESDLREIASALRVATRSGDTATIRAKTHVLISVAGAIGA
ncbi:MAG: response regulator, partial [Alphaproteobacteria bacterium]